MQPDLRQEHRDLMEKQGVSIDRMIDIRRDFHQHAEIAFKEHRTQGKIKEILKSFGLKDEEMKHCAGTGLVVDIKGTADAQESGDCNVVALRADIDALPMPEHNVGLPWITKTPFAHMCGHDGHMACLLAGA